MERHVKERLVGAAVLMAAAVILIPEMLSGPERGTTATRVEAERNGAFKTYTIDLKQPRNEPANGFDRPEIIDDRAPPPEEAIATTPTTQAPSSPETSPDSDVSVAAEAPPPAPAKETAPATQAATTPAIATTPPASRNETRSPQPERSTSAPSGGGWAVQLGSFSNQDTAERLAKQLKSEGHKAFVMPIRSGGRTLYRVRVGPMPDRAAAEAALQKLRGKSAGAAVVTHP